MAHFSFRRLAILASIALNITFAAARAENPSNASSTTVHPREIPDAVLHNPDMGWVLYENYPLDQDPGGSSTLVTLPNDSFDAVDEVAIMFSWEDVEREADKYDFSKVDHAYDYWSKRGKEIQLRLSATTLLWWSSRNPPAGRGTPEYVLSKLPTAAKQTRDLQGISYVVEDARDPYYRERLKKFLQAVGEHFNHTRPVTLLDLRGFGVWGEWHTGFQYPTADERKTALRGIIDLWCEALPNHKLALSYSYDPDGPKELFEGPTSKFDEASTSHYADFLAYSAFDHALTKPRVTFRRDGCGGAVHSNERKLAEQAFRAGRAPMFCEFVDGYAQSKAGGDKWVTWKIEDALSLHPNYINVLGYQCADARDFLRERTDLVDGALRRMGYRFVPTAIEIPNAFHPNKPFRVGSDWMNRGVGRALRDYDLQLLLVTNENRVAATAEAGPLETSQWIAGKTYHAEATATFANAAPGQYQLAIRLRDPKSGRTIEMPLGKPGPDGCYIVGSVKVTSP